MTPLNAAFDLSGKVVFATGAGRGIGRFIAEVLAQAGANVILNAATTRYVNSAAEEISAGSGQEVIPFVADLTRSDEVSRSLDFAMNRFGRVDVLVNALGDSGWGPLVAPPGSDASDLSDDAMLRIMSLNLNSAMLCTRTFGAQMLARRSGKVISISSHYAHHQGANLVVYTAAKTGLVGFTRALALEWASYNVQVNGIAPGIFPDPITFGARTAELEKGAVERAPLRRAGYMHEPGYLALYLASKASDYMTGQVIYLDGGLSL
jgi:NAD(P)-dependent dehydrogenase (short-subunit alcohol dehydrogenase family)